jgi:hypothetical protein
MQFSNFCFFFIMFVALHLGGKNACGQISVANQDSLNPDPDPVLEVNLDPEFS